MWPFADLVIFYRFAILSRHNAFDCGSNPCSFMYANDLHNRLFVVVATSPNLQKGKSQIASYILSKLRRGKANGKYTDRTNWCNV